MQLPSRPPTELATSDYDGYFGVRRCPILSPVYTDRSTIHSLEQQIPTCSEGRVSHPPTPDKTYKEHTPEVLKIIRAAEEAENARQDEFCCNEEARDRVFRENEARRDQEVVQLKDELRRALEEKLATLSSQAPAPVRVPREESKVGTIPKHPASTVAPIASCSDGTVTPDITITEIVRAEREQSERLLDAFREERKRHDQELFEERERLHQERDRRIVELEEELSRLREKLDSEKSFRESEEINRAWGIERDENLMGYLHDITSLIQELREEFLARRKLDEERWSENLASNDERNADMGAVKEMLSEALARQYAMDQRLTENEEGIVKKFGKVYRLSRTVQEYSLKFTDIEDLVQSLRFEFHTMREMFETFSDCECLGSRHLNFTYLSPPFIAWTTERQGQHGELVKIIRDTVHEQMPFNVQVSVPTFSIN